MESFKTLQMVCLLCYAPLTKLVPDPCPFTYLGSTVFFSIVIAQQFLLSQINSWPQSKSVVSLYHSHPQKQNKKKEKKTHQVLTYPPGLWSVLTGPALPDPEDQKSMDYSDLREQGPERVFDRGGVAVRRRAYCTDKATVLSFC